MSQQKKLTRRMWVQGEHTPRQNPSMRSTPVVFRHGDHKGEDAKKVRDLREVRFAAGTGVRSITKSAVLHRKNALPNVAIRGTLTRGKTGADPRQAERGGAKPRQAKRLQGRTMRWM